MISLRCRVCRYPASNDFPNKRDNCVCTIRIPFRIPAISTVRCPSRWKLFISFCHSLRFFSLNLTVYSRFCIQLYIGALPTQSVDDLRQRIVGFAKTEGRDFTEQLYRLLVQNEVDLHTYLDTKVAAMGVWCRYFEISLMASYFGIDITVFLATQPISRINACEFLNSRHQKLAEFRVDQNTCPHIYIYHHQYQRPFTPV